MIETPTVFVLGAGASVDFQFPVGKDLLQAVVDSLRATTQVRDNVLASGFSTKDVDDFADALRFSAEWSIDAFLEKRPAFMNVGKATMAAVLILKESTEQLFNPPSGFNWMQYLVGKMQGPTFEDFAHNRVTFVTFNFDRVLEHYLCTVLKNAWGKAEDEVGALLRKIPIIHLHGQLGFLPWQSDRATQIRSFEAVLDPEKIRIAAEGIKVVHEGIEDRDNRRFDNPIDPGDCAEVDSLNPDARPGWQARVRSACGEN
jgi:hypothetical protein